MVTEGLDGGGDQLGEETNSAVSHFAIKDNLLVFESPSDSSRMVMETKWGKPNRGKPRVPVLPHTQEDHPRLLGTGCTHTVTIRKLIMENAEVSFPSPASLGSTLQFHLPYNVTGQCRWLRLLPGPGLSDLSIPQAARHVSHGRGHAWPGPARGHFSMDQASQQNAQGD